MSFIWPSMLIFLLLAPLAIVAYVVMVGRREATVVALGTVRSANAPSSRPMRRRRHIPAALFLLAIVLLLAALARPTISVALPHQEGTVILAFDASNSMIADDLEPSRMVAAKQAASVFVGDQPSTIQIGVVAFSLGGLIVQQPTNVQADVLAAINRLAPEGGTSLAEGIFTSLRAIAGEPIVLDEAALEGDFQNVDIGYFGSAVIVILSDGENTSEPSPLLMAQLAANAGVKVFPIGLGSADGATVEIDGFRVATSLNEALLEEIAGITGGTYSTATDAEELREIYDTIDLRLSIDGEDAEITSLVAALALVLFVIGGVLTMTWFGRLP